MELKKDKNLIFNKIGPNDIPISQFVPEKLFTHEHVQYEQLGLLQTPPFWQGFDEHGSVTFLKKTKKSRETLYEIK